MCHCTHNDIIIVVQLSQTTITLLRNTSYESQRFAILTTDFESVGEDAELTATLKLKRPVVVRKHAAVIDGIYAGTSGHDVSKRG